MCLENVTPITDPEEWCGEGWKVFMYGADAHWLVTPCYGQNHPMPLGKWLHERDWERKGSVWVTEENYRLGWHVFLLKSDADRWAKASFANLLTVRHVKYRGAHTRGFARSLNGLLASIVADEIYVLPEDADVP